ncbi:MAG: 2-oxo acid dehydrogenase subunit E2 [Deltaproteobacteria bacterium]|nr:2-oxo acid dehydrogenase subunit E2 [Deltaproteobacteria bacterium]
MSRSFKLPDLGEGIHEGEVLSVLVLVGDQVKEGDPILEVETDKAAVEIPSPFTATITEILVKPGDVVKVGDALMLFSGDTEMKAGEKEVHAEVSVQTEAAGASESLRQREKEPVPVSPATRRLARELGVDLYKATASGPEGLVTAEDVKAFAEKASLAEAGVESAPIKPVKEPTGQAKTIGMDIPPLPNFEKWGTVERIPVRSIRRTSARQMSISWSQIPHVTSQVDVDITRLEAFRQQHKADIEKKGGRLTLTVFALKAAAAALKTYPNFNATFDMDAGELILKHFYHIGVAVDTEDGLIVPVVRDVDRKSITELSIELQDLVQRTRQRKIALDELKGGTFTITNIGHMGGGHFTPIINYPEVAIMGMGAARMKPVVMEKRKNVHEIVPRLILPLVITIDHRVLDGGDAHRFLRVVIDALEDPDVLMMTMT